MDGAKKINDNFWTDGESIFYQNYGMKKPNTIPEADVDTFQAHSYFLASDKNRVYAQSSMGEGLQIFTPEDSNSIVFFPEEISASAFADDDNLYHYNAHFIHYGNITDKTQNYIDIVKWLKANYPNRNAWWNNSDTFYQTLKLVKHNIYSDGKHFYHQFKADRNYDYPIYQICDDDYFLRLKNTDENSFEVLNAIYSKDANKVYFYSRKIPADAATFQVIDELFAQDKNGIWYNGRIAKIEYLNTFEVIKSSKKNEFHYAKDQFNVYANATIKIDKFSGYADLLLPLKSSDPDTFEDINSVWAKDKNNVYWFGKVYKKADASTFEKISEPPLTWVDYAKDKNNVYIANRQTVKKGLHGASFKILNKFWAKDDFVVYCLPIQTIIKTIDVKTFQIIDENGKSEDKNYVYEYSNYKVIKTKK